MPTLDELANAPPDPVPQQVTPSLANIGDLDALVNAPPDPVVQPKASTTGLTKEPLSGWVTAYQGIKDHWTLGASAVNQAMSGWNLAVNDGVDFEQANSTVETEELQ